MSTQDAPNTPRKPVIALMGEFSAGKSTLANLLICQGRSPVKVTATQRPPVWYVHGQGAPEVVDLRGEVTTISEDQLDRVPVETTKYIKISLDADILEMFEIIDMPGNSDPNMSSDVWRRAVSYADGVIWCSHATQAWRQSEAAVWDEMPPSLYDTSILLLTRYDKLVTDSDRRRVEARVRKETTGLFRELFPISLINALEAGDDHQKWIDSGANAFIECLLDMTSDIQMGRRPAPAQQAEPVQGTPALRAVPEPDTAQAEPSGVSAPGIAPRRIERKADRARPRPPRPEAGSQAY
ncbi:MAG: hypothetical protein AAFV31_18545 [Pseudomonadota bacterium]